MPETPENGLQESPEAKRAKNLHEARTTMLTLSHANAIPGEVFAHFLNQDPELWIAFALTQPLDDAKAAEEVSKQKADRVKNLLMKFGGKALALPSPHPFIVRCASECIKDLVEHSVGTTKANILSRPYNEHGAIGQKLLTEEGLITGMNPAAAVQAFPKAMKRYDMGKFSEEDTLEKIQVTPRLLLELFHQNNINLLQKVFMYNNAASVAAVADIPSEDASAILHCKYAGATLSAEHFANPIKSWPWTGIREKKGFSPGLPAILEFGKPDEDAKKKIRDFLGIKFYEHLPDDFLFPDVEKLEGARRMEMARQKRIKTHLLEKDIATAQYNDVVDSMFHQWQLKRTHLGAFMKHQAQKTSADTLTEVAGKVTSAKKAWVTLRGNKGEYKEPNSTFTQEALALLQATQSLLAGVLIAQKCESASDFFTVFKQGLNDETVVASQADWNAWSMIIAEYINQALCAKDVKDDPTQFETAIFRHFLKPAMNQDSLKEKLAFTALLPSALRYTPARPKVIEKIDENVFTDLLFALFTEASPEAGRLLMMALKRSAELNAGKTRKRILSLSKNLRKDRWEEFINEFGAEIASIIYCDSTKISADECTDAERYSMQQRVANILLGLHNNSLVGKKAKEKSSGGESNIQDELPSDYFSKQVLQSGLENGTIRQNIPVKNESALIQKINKTLQEGTPSAVGMRIRRICGVTADIALIVTIGLPLVLAQELWDNKKKTAALLAALLALGTADKIYNGEHSFFSTVRRGLQSTGSTASEKEEKPKADSQHIPDRITASAPEQREGEAKVYMTVDPPLTGKNAYLFTDFCVVNIPNQPLVDLTSALYSSSSEAGKFVLRIVEERKARKDVSQEIHRMIANKVEGSHLIPMPLGFHIADSDNPEVSKSNSLNRLYFNGLSNKNSADFNFSVPKEFPKADEGITIQQLREKIGAAAPELSNPVLTLEELNTLVPGIQEEIEKAKSMNAAEAVRHIANVTTVLLSYKSVPEYNKFQNFYDNKENEQEQKEYLRTIFRLRKGKCSQYTRACCELLSHIGIPNFAGACLYSEGKEKITSADLHAVALVPLIDGQGRMFVEIVETTHSNAEDEFLWDNGLKKEGEQEKEVEKPINWEALGISAAAIAAALSGTWLWKKLRSGKQKEVEEPAKKNEGKKNIREMIGDFLAEQKAQAARGAPIAPEKIPTDEQPRFKSEEAFVRAQKLWCDSFLNEKCPVVLSVEEDMNTQWTKPELQEWMPFFKTGSREFMEACERWQKLSGSVIQQTIVQPDEKQQNDMKIISSLWLEWLLHSQENLAAWCNTQKTGAEENAFRAKRIAIVTNVLAQNQDFKNECQMRSIDATSLNQLLEIADQKALLVPGGRVMPTDIDNILRVFELGEHRDNLPGEPVQD